MLGYEAKKGRSCFQNRPYFTGANGGIRTRDPQNHNLAFQADQFLQVINIYIAGIYGYF